MGLDWKDGTLTFRSGRRPWIVALVSLVLLAAGVFIAQYAIREHPNEAFGAFLMGLLLTIIAFSLLLQADISIEFDTVRLQVRETSRGWFGHRVRLLPFDQVASIGVDTMKDPRTNTEWESTGVLRPKSGSNWLLPSTDAVRVVANYTALPVKHQIIWSNQQGW